jgi:hypothetical protein
MSEVIHYDGDAGGTINDWLVYVDHFTNEVKLGDAGTVQAIHCPDDPNHIPPVGAGWVNLLAIGYRAPTGPLPSMSLAGKKMRVDVTMTDVGRQGYGMIGVWIQSYYPPIAKTINLFSISSLLCTAAGLAPPWNAPSNDLVTIPGSQRVQVDIPYINDPGNWVSMGTSKARAATYADLPNPRQAALAYVLDNWIDTGVIALHPKKSPKVQGRFQFHNIQIIG